MDTSVLLENKLRGTWSAPDFQQYLTAGRLEFASKEFATLEVGIKLRLLLSLLSLPAPQLASLRDGVQMVLRVAESDRDEWVRVVLAMVRRRLPSAQSLGWTSAEDAEGGAGAGSSDEGDGATASGKSSGAENGSTVKDKTNGTGSGAVIDGSEPSSQQEHEPPLSQDSLASTDGRKEGSGGSGDGHNGLDGDGPESIDYFEYSLREISKRLMGGSKSLIARTGAGVATTEVLSPEFVPLEWPYLCKEVFPPGVEIEDVNRHFVPIDVGAGGKLGGGAGSGAADSMAISAEARAAAAAKESAEREARIAQAVSAAERKAKSKKRGVKMVNEEGSAAAGGNGAAGGEAGAGANVPAAIQGILRDPKNNKLTDESRQAVLDFYEFEKQGRPAAGERLVPLSETQEYVDDNTAILATLVQLKLNYGDNTAKRVKSKKKYKLKEGAQPVVSPAPST